ncbi:sigma factor-like helix-turn-helix DNA-binding protein [Streptomyces sp. NPDC006739]
MRPRDYKIIRWRFVEELAWKEIGERLGVSRCTSPA